MKPVSLLEQLKLHVARAIRHGEFLLSTNTFGHVWIDTLNHPEAQTLIHDILAGFWHRYLAGHPGRYRLVTLEQFDETSTKVSPMTLLARRVVESVNSPDLQTQTVIVDPDSFDVFIDECPEDCQLFLVVAPAVPHDLLIAACQHLHELRHAVAGILTPVESEHLSEQDIRHRLGIDIIPFLVFQPQQDNMLPAITEIQAAPYTQYHHYFE